MQLKKSRMSKWEEREEKVCRGEEREKTEGERGRGRTINETQ